ATVFDVGANIGMFSLLVSELYPNARIFAFEPIQPIFDTLRLNMELYGKNVRIFPFGISDEPGAAEFTYYPRYSMMSGLTAYADSAGDIDVVKQYLVNQQQSRTR